MAYVMSDGVRIFYDVAGRAGAPPLVLVHGYTASGRTNWELSGWVEALGKQYRLLIPDMRGHGRSEKPHNPEAYSVPAMARDVLACMDAEGIERAIVFGYSMGGMITLELLLNHAGRVSAAIVGGMGSQFPERGRRRGPRQDEPGAEPPPQKSARRGIGFLAAYVRHYDPLASRAVWNGVFKGSPGPVDSSRLGEIHVPVLCAAGMRDALYPGVKELAHQIPGARLEAFSGRGHIGTVNDPRFKKAVLAFLSEVAAGQETPTLAT
jgi:pimeloyl-ACP methyl ester carboxylesterase